jgi:hypothetical protein
VSKESEQVLKKKQVAASHRVKEAGVEVPVTNNHRNARSQYRNGDDEQQGSEEYRPREQLDEVEQVQQGE